jgi:hypothetical protein
LLIRELFVLELGNMLPLVFDLELTLLIRCLDEEAMSKLDEIADE